MPLVATRGAASAQGFGEFAQSAAPNYIEDVFSTWPYTGNGSTQTITNGIDLAGKGGLVWMKNRNVGEFHRLYHANNTSLCSNATAGQQTIPDRLSFASNGFNLLLESWQYEINYSGQQYASWTFRKQAKFFDVVTWTGDGGTGTRTISHALGSAPGCVIAKATSTTGSWYVQHRSIPANQYLILQSTEGVNTGSDFNNQYADATSIYLNKAGGLNLSGIQYVAYLFAHNAGGFGLTGTDNVISCGSFTTDSGGNFSVSLGYEPQFVICKRTDASQNWFLADTIRGFSQTQFTTLNPNLSSGEAPNNSNYIAPNATGFGSIGNQFFSGSANYIYIAIRRGPMKTPTTGTSVYMPVLITGQGDTPTTTTGVGFPADLTFGGSRVANPAKAFVDRLRGRSQYLLPYSTNGEDVSSANQDLRSWSMNGFTVGQLWNTSFNEPAGGTNGNILWNFRRAPGFFDEVCYTGTGGSMTLNHNLGVAPELLITKSRSGTSNWFVIYSISSTDGNFLYLNLTNAASFWGATGFTATQFFAALDSSSVNYVAYLFASCPGVSKVGTYTGTGNTLQINCGFTGGARFVLIKRTDSTSNWFIWDSARGIVAGNDPYAMLNNTLAEVTNTDWVDTHSPGFELSNSAGNLVNANGGTYIFLAIA